LNPAPPAAPFGVLVFDLEKDRRRTVEAEAAEMLFGTMAVMKTKRTRVKNLQTNSRTPNTKSTNQASHHNYKREGIEKIVFT
jgi:hypothetical protein